MAKTKIFYVPRPQAESTPINAKKPGQTAQVCRQWQSITYRYAAMHSLETPAHMITLLACNAVQGINHPTGPFRYSKRRVS